MGNMINLNHVNILYLTSFPDIRKYDQHQLLFLHIPGIIIVARHTVTQITINCKKTYNKTYPSAIRLFQRTTQYDYLYPPSPNQYIQPYIPDIYQQAF